MLHDIQRPGRASRADMTAAVRLEMVALLTIRGREGADSANTLRFGM